MQERCLGSGDRAGSDQCPVASINGGFDAGDAVGSWMRALHPGQHATAAPLRPLIKRPPSVRAVPLPFSERSTSTVSCVDPLAAARSRRNSPSKHVEKRDSLEKKKRAVVSQSWIAHPARFDRSIRRFTLSEPRRVSLCACHRLRATWQQHVAEDVDRVSRARHTAWHLRVRDE